MQIKSKLKKVFWFMANPAFYKYFFYNVFKLRKLKKTPVIICGCPRSGTSLLMSILDSHPDIHVIPFETALLQYRPVEKRVFKSDSIHFLFTRFQLRSYLLSSKIKPSATIWCEKTPLNVLNVAEIRRVFNNQVTFIHIFRDGRDVVASYHPRFGYMVSPKLWKKCVIAGKSHMGDADFLTIKYEEMVEDPANVLNAIRAFLDLRVEFQMNNWLNKTSIKGFVKSPVNNNLGTSIISADVNVNSIGKWKTSSSPYVQEFLNDAECIALNNSLGYH